MFVTRRLTFCIFACMKVCTAAARLTRVGGSACDELQPARLVSAAQNFSPPADQSRVSSVLADAACRVRTEAAA